ncbi:NAD-dependent epimerase/dehydratase family protein [Streptomyces sp. NBC_00102]|uniref:NAD-dependent epimerase/dehydratase family protein n=1 Tax=Streptomyces sp. NBC_00102 TaxID=2975652 RepID=UPI002259ED74|nr:NAD-dependent epimerase/dehydratase family protein [Streptomyces sp. NBC_00102]MCX5397196.1 GDP-mannose 4,6-dehydratase [Streptomyces sp. NBC_00102]
MARRTAVVTGGAGFIGSHLCDALIRAESAVICVDNFLTGSRDNVAHLLASPHFDLIEQDVNDKLAVAGEVDVVFHLASPASPVDYLRHPIETLSVGSVGTLNALELARERGARFVLASTSEVYGDPHQHPQTEAYWGNVNPIGPRSVYDEAKRFAEAATAAYRREYGADTAIVRIFNTFGPRMRTDDGRAVPAFVTRALTGQSLHVAGDGRQSRSLCYVDDTVAGLLAVAASSHPGPVNLGTEDERTVMDIARLVLDLTGSAAGIEFVAMPEDDPGRRRPDTTLAREAFGWEPRIAIEGGLAATVTWFVQQLAAGAAR